MSQKIRDLNGSVVSVVSQIDGPLVKFFEGPPGECFSTFFIKIHIVYHFPTPRLLGAKCANLLRTLQVYE